MYRIFRKLKHVSWENWVSSGQSISTEARNDRLLKQVKYDVLQRKILNTG